ncbi:signal transduction histidine kinase [Catalinimonas alkaloidigena]|uniref:sensor histidine kinase n=1 Tax=Catalinimonas alkaloidigena TaxID=1075417 RepID=UPI002405CA8F|nr:HAMP domain-containing sensor histidine kinase [Catalinimonas alkaloidigena]MDF9796511.1 signal transduction histidine kinase [Catalinimonas alkaloidigena]
MHLKSDFEIVKNNLQKNISQHTPVEELLTQIIKWIEKQSDEFVLSILVANHANDQWQIAAAPSLSSDLVELIKLVVFKQLPEIKSNSSFEPISKKIIWKDSKHPSPNGWWVTPIHSRMNGKLLGAFLLFFKDYRSPKTNEISLIINGVDWAATVIEQKMSVDAILSPEVKQQSYTEELERKVKERTRELTAMVKKLVETNLSLQYQIHETRQADAQAKKNYALYVAIARYFPKVMIVVINRDYRIVFLDGEELRKIALNKEKVEGLSVKEVENFSSEWKKQMISYAQKTFEGGHHSYEIKHKTNSYKVNTMPLDEGQADVNLVMFVFTNVSEQKSTEKKMLKALKKEKELSELKSRFVSMASHEFRTPLSTILSSANLIARLNEPGKEEKRLKNVERIKSSVKNLIDILNEFLSLGRLEEGALQMKKEVFDLMEFMEIIVQELQHVQKPGQEVRLTSDQESIHVNLDKQFTRNVFLNLLSNALKYSPQNKPVDLMISTKDTSLTVKIKDQGIGIPEDEQQNLFNLFFRARNVTNIEGTGLGLPIVKKYIELMKGEITFDSKIEQGSTFTITLPLDQEENA